jgi:hypothetical protein
MPGGRPRKTADRKLLHELAAIGCTMKEIAIQTDLSVATLERRFADVIEKGREFSKASLRRNQMKAADSGNITMMIWLGKQLLGQKDRSELSGDSANPLGVQLIHSVPQPDRGEK